MKTVSNLKIDAPESDYVGLFGHVAGGTLQNINISGVNIVAKKGAGSL